jgi:tRNA (guanosine-2'-O-)-methyltransferase
VVDTWLAHHSPSDIVAALAPQLTSERRERIERVLERRLDGLTVVLENLHDPHNGAAALRSVEGFGLSELHVVETAEPFRFSSRVTQGCEKWVGIAHHRSFDDVARTLHERGFQLYAALPGQGQALHEIDVTIKTALVFGNEHSGLSAHAQALCDARFGIPMQGFTESFNLSVSVALSVYDAARRRRAAGPTPSDLSDDEHARLRARFYALSMDPRAAQGIVERYVAGLAHRC